MFDREKLVELAERVEKASGPDRDLDARVHCVREGLEFVLLATGTEVYGDICDPDDSGYRGRSRCTPGLLYARYPDEKNPPTLGGGRRGNKVQGCHAPLYTASLDAAITLANGMGGQVTFFKDGTAKAFLWQPYPMAVESKAATAALALTAACLRALAQGRQP